MILYLHKLKMYLKIGGIENEKENNGRVYKEEN